MTPFILYQLKAGVCLMLFTALYYVLFRKETFHRFNRFYLLGALLLSAILPVIHLAAFSTNSTAMPTRIIGAVMVYASKVSPANADEVPPDPVLSGIYLTMALLFAVYLLVQLFHLLVTVFRNEVTSCGDYRIIVMPEKAHSFSFFNLVFISKSVIESDRDNQVLLHELAHAKQWHSLDNLIIQIIKIFQWFNPFVYFTEKALNETHEYLADMSVLEQDGQSDRYRLLLLTQVFGIQPGIFNFFNHSLIKNRLTMMTKEKSPTRSRLKYLAALPLIFILGLLMCCRTNKTEELAPPPPPPPPPEKAVVSDSLMKIDEPNYVFVDVQAEFQGGDINTFRDWVQKNLVYPPEAIKNGIFGRVTVQFSISSKGKICDIKVLRGVDPLLDKETIRVMESSPDWVPAKAGGKDVGQQFVIPVVFMLQ